MTIDTIAHGRCLQRNVHLEELWVHRLGSRMAHILVRSLLLLISLKLDRQWFSLPVLVWYRAWHAQVSH
jgi:hypothetical protein